MAPKKYNRGVSSQKELDYYLTSPKHENGKYFLGIKEAKTRTKLDRRLCLDPVNNIVYLEYYKKGYCINTKKKKNTIKQFIERNCLDTVIERLEKFGPERLAKPIKKAIPIRIID